MKYEVVHECHFYFVLLLPCLSWVCLLGKSRRSTRPARRSRGLMTVVVSSFLQQYTHLYISNFILTEILLEYSKLLCNCLAFLLKSYVSQNFISQVLAQYMALVPCIQKCAGVLISTVGYFSIARARFAMPIRSELKFQNCLAFLYPVLDLLKFQSGRELPRL